MKTTKLKNRLAYDGCTDGRVTFTREFSLRKLMVLNAPRPTQSLNITWEALPEDYRLPDDPVEHIQQPLLAAALTDALGEAGLIQPEMLIASNFGLVANVSQKTVVKAPDWLYVPRVLPWTGEGVRRSYTPILQGDRWRS